MYNLLFPPRLAIVTYLSVKKNVSIKQTFSLFYCIRICDKYIRTYILEIFYEKSSIFPKKTKHIKIFYASTLNQ